MLNSENILNNIVKKQKQRKIVIPNINKNERNNKGISELYKLYISNDYKPYQKNGSGLGLYLPNIYVRKNSGKRYNSNSHISSKDINSNKRLSPLNKKV